MKGRLLFSLMFFAALGDAQRYFSSSEDTQVDIGRDGCGQTKLCLATPDLCDPRGSSSCLFTSAEVNGSALTFELRGDSSGYVALGLTSNTSQGASNYFICGQNNSNNGSFFFRGAWRNNSVEDAPLITLDLPVEGIRNKVRGDVIQCVFKIPTVDSKSRSFQDMIFTVLLGNGSVSGDDLGSFTLLLEKGPLDLSDPKADSPTTVPPDPSTAVPSTTGPTTAGPTTAGPSTAGPSTAVPGASVRPEAVLSALLMLPSVLTLTLTN